MKVEQVLWSIQDLLTRKDKINLNPAWQRGPAWRESRRVLLVDSILRGMDIPKIYLRRLPSGGLYDYEAVDGQQRLRAIWDFLTSPSQVVKAHGFPLKARPALAAVDGHEISEKSFSGLDKKLRDKFMSFKVGIGEITESTNDEITVLFARLQMGMPLNPAELRNADLGPMRNIIQLMATSHEFFANTPMRDERTKHFDYASFAFATAMGIGKMDMKAPDLRELQQKCNGLPAEELMQLSSKVGEALNVLSEVDQHTAYPVTRKWIFVDLLGLIMSYHDSGKAVDVAKFTEAYDGFETRRRAYTSQMDKLLDSKRKDAEPLDRHLYDYLAAFRTEGAKATSLVTRQNALKRFFKNVEVK